MAKLTSPSGVTVDVSDAKAEKLRQIGYSAETKAPAKKAASSTTKKSASSDDK